jgi:PadR family transcriptional regulator, regulatory protein AphA
VALSNRTKQALLGFLSWRPMSGYELRKVIAASISNFWSESYGQIYPILRQLEREGLAARSSRMTAGGRPRCTYRITGRGRAELSRWLAEPVEPRPKRNELLLKVFFAMHGTPDAAVEAVERFRAEQASHAEHYALIRQKLEAVKQPAADLPYWLLTLDYGEREAAAHLAWCDAALPLLRARGETEAGNASSRRSRRAARR